MRLGDVDAVTLRILNPEDKSLAQLMLQEKEAQAIAWARMRDAPQFQGSPILSSVFRTTDITPLLKQVDE